MEIKLKDESIEEIILHYRTILFPDDYQTKLDEIRNGFISYYNTEMIKKMKPEDYFLGHDKKQGCLSYELEYGTIELGSIRGGSKYKFGYEEDFDLIKNLLLKLIEYNDNISIFYNNDGSLSKVSKELCKLTISIKGLKSGRTSIGKLLCIYYPKSFIPIFTDQNYILDKLLYDYEVSGIGLELFFYNNYLLLKIKEVIQDKLVIPTKKDFSNVKYAKLLTESFPKPDGPPKRPGVGYEGLDALERQHFQKLINMNFNRLFGKHLKYFVPDIQNQKDGQYDTQEVGIMDFLCTDSNNDFVVIELKRRAIDQTLGQILRYMGWVKETLCKANQKVKGIILAEKKDISLYYALKVIPNIQFKRMKLNIDIIDDSDK